MDGSSVQQTTENLCLLLQSVDEELRLLTEELLPPLREAPLPGGPPGGSPHAATTEAAAASAAPAAAAAATPGGNAERMREQRAKRRYELMEKCVGVCVSVAKDLHQQITQQPPLRNSTSGSRNTCVKLAALNLEALRKEMLALQVLKQQLL